ncbi:YkgJ family cysteine cluster protein [Desulfatiferula olefinivorans]
MKSVDPHEIDALPGRRLAPGDTFHFRCHEGLSCFNLCCRNLNLFLYPYDLLRLKNNLGITAGAFIDRYTDIVLRPGHAFPDVLLNMADNEEKTCPFLTDRGCSVYPDRPDTCRTFPVEQGLLFEPGSAPRSVSFFRPPDFCLGRHESQAHTPATWAADQDADTHNRMTALFAEIRRLFDMTPPFGAEGPGGPQGKMAFMALFNVDDFRSFVFESSFFKRYKVKDELKKKIRRSDVAMMLFGFEFVKVAFFRMTSPKLRLK